MTEYTDRSLKCINQSHLCVWPFAVKQATFFYYWYSHKQGTLVSTFSNAIRHHHPYNSFCLSATSESHSDNSQCQMEGLVPFCFDFLAVTWCGPGSSFGAAEQQLPVEENWNDDNVTFRLLHIFNIRHTSCSHVRISCGRSTSATRRPDGNRVYDCRQGHNNPQQGVGR